MFCRAKKDRIHHKQAVFPIEIAHQEDMNGGGVPSAIIAGLYTSFVPLFSYNEQLSMLTQLVGLMMLLPAAFALVRGTRIPTPILWYISFIALSGLSLLFVNMTAGVLKHYMTLLKIGLLTFACSLSIWEKRQVLIVFALYACTTIPTLIMNWSAFFEANRNTIYIERFAGSFYNPNALSSYSLLCVFSCLMTWHCLKGFWRHTLLLPILPVFYANIATGSRQGMIGICLLILVIAAVILKDPIYSKAKRWGMLLTVIVIASFAFYEIYKSPLFYRLEETYLDAESGTSARVGLIMKALEDWRESPLFGKGFGFMRFRSDISRPSHNAFSDILADQGIIGLIFYLMFFFTMGLRAFRVFRMRIGEDSRLAIWCLGFLSIALLLNMVGSGYERRELMPMLGVVAGFLFHRRPEGNNSQSRYTLFYEKIRLNAPYKGW
jgi:O-antigen ligase